LSDIPHTFIPHFTLATHCLILGVGFRVKLSDQDIAEIECLMVVAMATNFGTKIATGFVWTIATGQLAMGGGWVVGWQNADISDTLHLRDLAMATTFWLSMGYKTLLVW